MIYYICSKYWTSDSIDTFSIMFIATLFKIARECKQPEWPSSEEWIIKMC